MDNISIEASLIKEEFYTQLEIELSSILNKMDNNKNYNKTSINLNYPIRKFSTSSIKNNFNSNNIDYSGLETGLEKESNELKLLKDQEIKNFKKIYSGGYLGYSDVSNFGDISHFINIDDSLTLSLYIKILEPKFDVYLKDLPENITYSILPVLRWQFVDGNYKSITISNSIKITRFTSCDLLAKRVVYSLQDALLTYDLRGVDIYLFIFYNGKTLAKRRRF